MSQLFLLLFALLTGVMLAVQAPLNTGLGKAVGSPVYGALLSFLAGLLALFAYVLVDRSVRFADVQGAAGLPWYYWMGGVLGAVYVAGIIILAPRLGVALTFGLSLAGQMAVGLLIDHYGWLGIPAHAINWPRLLGVGLIVAGVVLIRGN